MLAATHHVDPAHAQVHTLVDKATVAVDLVIVQSGKKRRRGLRPVDQVNTFHDAPAAVLSGNHELDVANVSPLQRIPPETTGVADPVLRESPAPQQAGNDVPRQVPLPVNPVGRPVQIIALGNRVFPGQVAVANPASLDADQRLETLLWIGFVRLVEHAVHQAIGDDDVPQSLALDLVQVEVRFAPVDAVVGPGNRWVTEAKRQVAGQVVIDSPAGPSEVLVLADEQGDPQLVARELMAQAEHDPDAACVLVTTSAQLAANVEVALVDQLQSAPRAEICIQAFRSAGAILTADSLEEAMVFTRRYAPEHLSIMTVDAAADAKCVGTAGTIFVGAAASVAFGDYLTGANHVLPTAGRAKSFSGLCSSRQTRASTFG